MNKFILSALSVLSVALFSFSLAALYAFIKTRRCEKSDNEKTDEKPKIYYITRQTQRKKRKKPPKKTEIALKSIAVEPEKISATQSKAFRGDKTTSSRR